MTEKPHVSRRRFIGAAGLAATGVAANVPLVGSLPASALENVVGANEYLRLGWLGVGRRGTSLLNAALASVSVSTLKVSAICDLHAERRQAAVSKCGGMNPIGVADYHELVERKDVDAVVIATPIHLHSEHAVAALSAGKHVYCEKPLGRNPEEVKAVYDAVKRSGRRFQVGFQWRYQGGFRAFVDTVQSGTVGDVRLVLAQRHAGGYPTDGWYVDRNLSGDLIVEQAVHEMNIFCWMLKSHPLRAAGFGGINELRGVPPERTSMDHYVLSYEFPRNVTLRYSHCIYSPSGFDDGLRFTIYGSDKRGAEYRGTSLSVTQNGKRTPVKLAPWGNATQAAIQAFAQAVREDSEPLCNVDAGRAATLMAILGRTALHERRVVEWDEVAF